MARPRSFDLDQALDAAIDAFWARGYAATSVRDLGAAMGLGPASLYGAFGDKRGVFVRALDRYLDANLRSRLAQYRDLPPRFAVEAFLHDTVERSLADPRGCLLVNAAIDVAPHDPPLGSAIADRLGEIEAFFRERIGAGIADRTLTCTAPADTARLLLATVLGLRVLARSKRDPALLQGIARQALALLQPGLEERQK